MFLMSSAVLEGPGRFSVERTKYLMLSKSMPGRGWSPCWHRLRRCAQAPSGGCRASRRFALLRRDVAHHVLGEPPGAGARDVSVQPSRSRSGPARRWSPLAQCGYFSPAWPRDGRQYGSLLIVVVASGNDGQPGTCVGAGAVAVDDGCQSLDVGYLEMASCSARTAPGNCLSRGKPGSGAGRSTCPGSGRAPGWRWWRVTGPGQCVGHLLGGLGDRFVVVGIDRLDPVGPMAPTRRSGEGQDRLVAADLAELAVRQRTPRSS